jgi:hypothetical protein
VESRQIEVNTIEVRRALARSFVGADAGGHAWRGNAETEALVTVDVLTLPDGRPYVSIWADALEAQDDDRLASLVLMENAELVLGRFRPVAGRVRVEHAILAGTTMDAVEVQASVWTVGWSASAFAPRLRGLLTDAVPPPPPPQTPAALRRDAADHVAITERRVRRLLDERLGGFEHDPNWGYHGGFGSARVFVDVLPVLEDSTAVRASSPVVSDVDLVPALARRLLELQAQGAFGGFLYLPNRREVWFQHVILGDDLDENELEAAIEVVAATADGCDDELTAAFGGKRYADL